MEIDIMKVMDVNGWKYSSDFINRINSYATYRDQVLKEHLYDPADILEQTADENILSEEEKKALQDLQQLMNTHSASYCRFIFL